MFITLSYWARSVVSMAPMARIPALLTRTSSRPKWATVCSTVFFTVSSSVRSPGTSKGCTFATRTSWKRGQTNALNHLLVVQKGLVEVFPVTHQIPDKYRRQHVQCSNASQAWVTSAAPHSTHSRATFRRFSSSRPLRANRAPSLANRTPVPAPIPELAPVIKATFPLMEDTWNTRLRSLCPHSYAEFSYDVNLL